MAATTGPGRSPGGGQGDAGQCKEAFLWFGRKPTGERRAAVLVGDHRHRCRSSGSRPPLDLPAPGMGLHEPHPALIRADVFVELRRDLDAHLFDPQIAYLVADELCPSSLVQSFLIDEVHPYTLKLLNRRRLKPAIGRVELQKRGFPLEPESLRPPAAAGGQRERGDGHL